MATYLSAEDRKTKKTISTKKPDIREIPFFSYAPKPHLKWNTCNPTRNQYRHVAIHPEPDPPEQVSQTSDPTNGKCARNKKRNLQTNTSQRKKLKQTTTHTKTTKNTTPQRTIHRQQITHRKKENATSLNTTKPQSAKTQKHPTTHQNKKLTQINTMLKIHKQLNHTSNRTWQKQALTNRTGPPKHTKRNACKHMEQATLPSNPNQTKRHMENRTTPEFDHVRLLSYDVDEGHGGKLERQENTKRAKQPARERSLCAS